MDSTNRTFVQIDSIKPDPNQPRKKFDPRHIEGLKVSLTQEGMINPIEIDAQMVIITGECRWRSAKELGWEEVPVVINNAEFTPYLRLRHQMAENVHQSGSTYDTMMNPIDTAKGYLKLIQMREGKDVEPGSESWHREVYGKGLTLRLADEMGINQKTIEEHLKLLEQPESVQNAIQEGTPRTYFREADKAVEGVRDQIKDKIIEGHYKSRDEIQQDAELSKKIPDLAKIELERQKSRTSIVTNRILNSVSKLALAMEKLPLDKVDIRERGIIEKQLRWLILEIEGYLMVQNVEGEEV